MPSWSASNRCCRSAANATIMLDGADQSASRARRCPMKHITLLLAVLSLLIAITVHPVLVRGQDTNLSSYLPEGDQLPADLMVVDQGTRSLDEVANTFPDPVTAKQHLESWGWQENVILELAPTDPSSSHTSQLQISLHRFETDAGAAAAMDYFVTERAAALELQNTTRPGDIFHIIEGAVDGGFESTVYAQTGPIVVRVTARQRDESQLLARNDSRGLASGQVGTILDAIDGFGHY